MGRRKWERKSNSKFKFVCLHMHAHTHGVKNSFAKGVLKPYCNNVLEYAKQESKENTALALCLSDRRQKHQSSSNSFGVLRIKHMGWQSWGKALSAFLPKDVEPMSWKLCPFIPLLPTASSSWKKTLSNSNSAGRDDQCNFAHPWSAPNQKKPIREEPLGITPAQGQGGKMLQESQSRRWYFVLQIKDAVQVWAFPSHPNFCLTSMWDSLQSWSCCCQHSPTSSQREGERKLAEYCMIRGRERHRQWPHSVLMPISKCLFGPSAPTFILHLTAHPNALHCWPRLTWHQGTWVFLLGVQEMLPAFPHSPSWA